MNITIDLKVDADFIKAIREVSFAILTLAEVNEKNKEIVGQAVGRITNSEVASAPAAQPVPAAPIAPAPFAPVQQPVTAVPPAPAPAPVPTTAQTYSMEQLAVAATQLVDAGRRTELVQLLSSFGVQALTALPKERYGNFATQLRAMGAKI